MLLKNPLTTSIIFGLGFLMHSETQAYASNAAAWAKASFSFSFVFFPA
jgi:hypothetical protein